MAITAEVIILLNVFGVKVDDKRINAGVLAVCTLFVIIGVFNDKGMRTTKFNK